MRLNKYPDNRRDRIIFWFFLLGIAIEVGLAMSWSPWWLLLLVLQGYGIIGTLEPSAGAVEDFSDMYGRRVRELGDITSALGKIMKFAQGEQRRIKETQATLEQLNREKENVLNFLDTEKPKADDFIRAVNSIVKKLSWRERVNGFVGGVTSSVVASGIWYLICKYTYFCD